MCVIFIITSGQCCTQEEAQKAMQCRGMLFYTEKYSKGSQCHNGPKCNRGNLDVIQSDVAHWPGL